MGENNEKMSMAHVTEGRVNDEASKQPPPQKPTIKSPNNSATHKSPNNSATHQATALTGLKKQK